ncbi:unnamed protein product, partial [Ixodes persulcatus]
MDVFKPPEGLNLTGNVAENWQRFKQRVELYLRATETTKRTDEQRAAILLHVAGLDAIEVYNTFTFAPEEKQDYQTVLKKFKEYCMPRRNETYERYVFRSRKQESGEPFEKFVRELQLKVKSCNFSTLSDSMVRDQIVCGVTDKKLRERLLREDLTLEKAIQLGKAYEVLQAQNETLDGPRRVDTVDKKKRAEMHERKVQPTGKNCPKCDRKHDPRKCPAYNKKCNKCHRMNHFAVCCKTKSSVDEVKEQDDSDFAVLQVSACKTNKGDEWLVKALVANKEVELKVDTGSQANLLPSSLFQKLHKTASLKPSISVLKSYNDSVIAHQGKALLEVKLKGKSA